MNTKHLYILLTTMLTGVCFNGLSTAGSLGLSQEAMELRTGSDPNVFILMDDSGSMSLETITKDPSKEFTITNLQPDGSSAGSGASFIDMFNKTTGYLGESPSTNRCANTLAWAGYSFGWHFDDVYIPYSWGYLCHTAYFDNWRFRNSDFNRIYFDPSQTYEPWPGLDQDGNLMTDITLTAMPSDPYKSSPETVSIDTNYRHWRYQGWKWRAQAESPSGTFPQGFVYYDWSDADGDGLFDDNDTISRISMGSASADVRQNYANWFGY